MGLLDLPAPLLSWIDAALGGLPPLARLVFWGMITGIATMGLYRAISPQARIARAKQDQLDIRRRLDAFDGELSEAWPLISRLLRLSLTHVGRVAVPAVIASVPVLCVLVWLSTAYGHQFPQDGAPVLRVVPADLDARWLARSGPGGIIELEGRAPSSSTQLIVTAPVTEIERRHWWNLFIGNPAGYLRDDAPARRIEINLPRQQFLNAGPGWLRGWEFPFFAALLTASLIMKWLLRIH